MKILATECSKLLQSAAERLRIPEGVAVGLFALGLAFVLTACGGSRSDGDPAVPPTRLLAGTTTSYGSMTQEVVGEVRVAVVLVTSAEIPLISTVTPAFMREVFFDADSSVARMLADFSYGKVNVTGKVIGPVTIAGNSTRAEAFDASLRAAAQLEDLHGYQHIVFMGPMELLKPISRGEGSLGKVPLSLPDGTNIQAGIVYLTEIDAASRAGVIAVALHELGHNFALHHANLSYFGTEPLGPAGLIPDGSATAIEQVLTNPLNTSKRSLKSLEYGDGYSNMGSGTLEAWSAPHRAMLGWLRENDGLQTVQASGTYTLAPITQAGTGTKALRIRRGTGNNAWLMLEFRKGDRSDGAPLYRDSVLIHYEDENWLVRDGHTHTVHMHPNRSGTSSDSGMLPSETWKDPYSDLQIRLAGPTPDAQQVIITYGPTPAVTLAPKTALVQAPGGTVAVEVTAPADMDWAAKPGASWIRIVSGANGRGPARLVYEVAPSDSVYARGGTIAVGDAVIAVAQAGVPGAVTLSTTEVEVPAVGGKASLVISSTASDYHYGIGKCEVDDTNTFPAEKWISNFKFSNQDLRGAFGSGKLEFILSPNMSAKPRRATFPIDGKVVTIEQAAGPAQAAPLDWERVALTDAPASREGMAMAAMGDRGEFVLFGGYPPGFMVNPLDETWVWNGTEWSRRHPAHSPGALQGHAMAYDAQRGKMVLFGGSSPDRPWGTNDTWEWDGQDWTKRNPPTSPPARLNHAMAYNVATGRIVLFGGQMDNLNGELGDTWEWDGTTWSKLESANAPSRRMRPSMAYDMARKEVILFGGMRNTTYIPPEYIGTTPSTFETYGDTWSWNGERWELRATDGPQPRFGAALATIPDQQQVVMIGGTGWIRTSENLYFGRGYEESWTWNGTAWSQLFPEKSPEYSDTYGFGYDHVHKTVFAFLGDELHCKERGPHMYAMRAPALASLPPGWATNPDKSGVEKTGGNTKRRTTR